MSRVTKLQKQYRRQEEARRDRWRAGHSKSRRIRRAQGGKLYNWEPGYRGKKHQPVLRWHPITESHIDREFRIITHARASAILSAFAMVGNVSELDKLS